MNTIKPIISALVSFALLASASVFAEPEMDTMTVTYRTPIDYALYVHNTETIALYRLEVEHEIIVQARNHSLQTMANLSLAASDFALKPLNIAKDKDIETVGLSQAAE